MHGHLGMRHLALIALLGLAACVPNEVRVSHAQGVHSIDVTLSAAFTSYRGIFACGDTFTGTDALQHYTVTTVQTEAGCDFTFEQHVELLNAADYGIINEFKDGLHFVQRIELDLTRMSFYDDQGERFALKRLADLQFSVNGQVVLDLGGYGLLPRSHIFSGAALEGMKRDVRRRAPCAAHLVTHLLLLDDESLSTGVRLEYDAQPTFVVSDFEL